MKHPDYKLPHCAFSNVMVSSLNYLKHPPVIGIILSHYYENNYCFKYFFGVWYLLTIHLMINLPLSIERSYMIC